MHRNPVWLSFLCLIILLSLFFTYLAVQKAWTWSSYSQKIEVRVLKWKLVPNKSGNLQPELIYLYSDGEENQIFSCKYKNKYFRNEWAANKFLDDVKNISTWTVWVRPNRPDSAIIERAFPWKSVVYASLLIGLTIYFFWLGTYVVKLQKNH